MIDKINMTDVIDAIGTINVIVRKNTTDTIDMINEIKTIDAINTIDTINVIDRDTTIDFPSCTKVSTIDGDNGFSKVNRPKTDKPVCLPTRAWWIDLP